MKEIKWDHDRATEVMRYGTTWRPPVEGFVDIPDDAKPGESFFDVKAWEDRNDPQVWVCVAEGEVMQTQFAVGPQTCPHCGK
jgi:hypothetical protein